MNAAGSSQLKIISPREAYDSERFVGSESPCPYLPGNLSRVEAYVVDALDGRTYETLMGRGFRRSGRVLYRPRCRSCDACKALRVPVDQFTLGRTQRRVWRRNSDVRVAVHRPEPAPDKFALFRRYLEYQHDGTMSRTYEAFQTFLYDSPLESLEFRYLLGERVIGISIADRCPGGLSSVYMYYDPEVARRSLGTYSILWEIDYCRRHGLAYYYLGFHVEGCRSMEYKANYRPNELLSSDGRWISFLG